MRRFANDMARCLPAAALLALLTAVPATPAQQPSAPATNPAGARKPVRVEEEEEQARPHKTVAKEGEEKDKATLEDLLAEALKNNPDLRVANAKVQEAEAELNRTRLTVLQKVATFYASRKAAQAKVAEAEQRFARMKALLASSAISQEEYRLAEQSLRTAKAELELVEADLPGLLGRPPQKMAQATEQGKVPVLNEILYLNRIYRLQMDREQEAGFALALAQHRAQLGQAAPGTVAEKVRKALNTPLTVDFRDASFSEILDFLEDRTGITIHNQLTRYREGDPKITLRFKEPLPLRAVLQALEDEFPSTHDIPGVRFVVREYGLLVVPGNVAPPGAVFVDQLGPADTGEKTHSSEAKNPPAGDVEGVVKSVEEKGGLVTVSLGSDAGVAKGNTLEVFRLNPAKYLGTLRVVQVTAHEAVAQPVGRPVAPIQAGDRVASRILGQ